MRGHHKEHNKHYSLDEKLKDDGFAAVKVIKNSDLAAQLPSYLEALSRGEYMDVRIVPYQEATRRKSREQSHIVYVLKHEIPYDMDLANIDHEQSELGLYGQVLTEDDPYSERSD
jgi:hypothetical protein